MVTKLRPPIELYKPPSLRTEGDGNDQEDCLPTFKEQVQHQQALGGTTESSGHFPGSGSRHGDQAFGQQAKLTGHNQQQQNLGQNPAASFGHQQATAIGSGGGMQPGAGQYLGQPATAGNPNAAASSAAVPMSFQSHMAMAGGAGPPLLPTPARFGLQQPRTAADFYLNNMAFYAAAAAAAGANGPHGPAVHAMPSMMPLGAAQLQLSKSTTNLAGLFPSAAAQQAAQLYQPFCVAAPGLKQPSAAAGLAPRFQRNEHLFQPESLQLHQQHQQQQQQQQQQQRQQQQARHYTSGHHTYHVVTGRLNDLGGGGGGGHHHQHQHHGPTTSGPAPQQQHYHQTGAGGLSLKRSKSLGAADFYKQQQHQQEALARTRSTGFLLHQLPAESREVYAEALSNPGGLSGKRLMDLAETTLTNAVGDRKLARPCAEVCASIAAREAGCTFTESLLNACREWFMRRNEKLFETPSNSAETVGQSSTARNDSTPSTPTHASSPTAGGSAEVDGGNAKNVSKWIAYAAFVAELYFQMKVVRPKRNQDQPPAPILLQILYECIYVSLKSGNLNNPQELEALELVLSSVGRDLDAEKPKKMDTVFTTIRENFLLSGDLVSASKKVLLQLVELRASGWQLSKAATVYYYVPGSGVACSGNNGTGGGVNSGCHPASPSSASSKVPGAGSAGSDNNNGN